MNVNIMLYLFVSPASHFPEISIIPNLEFTMLIQVVMFYIYLYTHILTHI